jgi:hypothetical protein
VTDRLRANANLVDSLGSAARHGGSALADAPVLLRRVLEEDAWREFVTQRGDEVRHARFADFVTTAPLKGLGVDMVLIERIVGTRDPDLLRLLRAAKAGKAGRPRPDVIACESHDNQGADYLSDRLARDHPDQYAAVKAGELSINAAAVLAGIRPRRVSVRTDDPASVARSLRKHMTPDQIVQVARLLSGDT